jgi:hypothetical protein
MRFLALAAVLALAACNNEPQPKTLKELADAHDWQHAKGAELQKMFDAGAKSVLGKMTRPDAITALNEAGYECIYGEAHEDYPDPMAVCTRSFATRACQMDWEIASTADKGKVQDVDGTFTRDCVGVADDWPEPKKSAIDDQLAPPNLPPTEQKPVEQAPAPDTPGSKPN